MGKIYSVVPCTLEDIPFHTERVLSYWKETDVNIEEQIEYLAKSIESNKAFKLINDSNTELVIIYCNELKRQVMQSNLLWIKSKTFFSILSYHLRQYENIRVIQFKPHSKNYIPFEFILNDSSIRAFYSHNAPLIIDLYSRNNQLLYENYFKAFNVEEVM